MVAFICQSVVFVKKTVLKSINTVYSSVFMY